MTTATTQTIHIKRVQHGVDHPYFAAARKTAQDDSLSFEARGMLLYLLSKPDDWEVQPKDLESKKCKRTRVYSILEELRDAGYIVYQRIRGAKGRIIEHRYDVYERPYVEFPDMARPDMVSPDVDFADAYIKENKESHNTDSTEQESPPTPTTQPEPSEPIEGKAAPERGGEGGEKPVKAKPEKVPDYLKNPHLYAQEPVSDEQFQELPAKQQMTALLAAICWHVEKSAETPADVYRIVSDVKSGMERALYHHISQVKGATPKKLVAFIVEYRKDPYGAKAANPGLIASKLRKWLQGELSGAVSSNPHDWTDENHPDPEVLKNHPARTWIITAYIRLLNVPKDQWWAVFKRDESELWANIRHVWDTLPGARNLLKDLAPVVEQKLKGA